MQERLLAWSVGLAAIVNVVLSLDATVVLLTPVLVGVNVGANLTLIGSPAKVLWRQPVAGTCRPSGSSTGSDVPRPRHRRRLHDRSLGMDITHLVRPLGGTVLGKTPPPPVTDLVVRATDRVCAC